MAGRMETPETTPDEVTPDEQQDDGGDGQEGQQAQ
jgi:hypothetical protein